MKSSLKKLAIISFSLAILICCGGNLNAQRTSSGADLEKQVISGHFTFAANTASPLRGGTKYLDASYDVKLLKDTVVSYLPYYGVAEQPPLTSDEAGIRFTSTKFEYSCSAKEKDHWNVQVVFKDQSATRQFNFTIYENGSAALDVTSNFRDPISFKGYIKNEMIKK